jgi:putative ABC transport system permease protein
MPDTWLLRSSSAVINLLTRLAPAWRREDWRREWLGELHFRASRLAAHGRLTPAAQVRLFLRCASAWFHVLWLWNHEWSLDLLTQDIRYGARMLRRRPTLSLIAVTTLALGIGATTALFSGVHAVLLKPLPYPDPERLVRIYTLDMRPGQGDVGNLSVPDAADFERRNRSFDAFGAFNYGGYFTLTGTGEPERLPRLLVTSGYFRALGAQLTLGRLFTPDEDRPSPPSVVVISHGFWQRRFGGDPSVIGKAITLSGGPATIVGVLASGFVHPDPKIERAPDVFALLDPDPEVSGRGGRYVRGIGRMKANVTREVAEADLRSIAAALEKDYPKSNTGQSSVVQPLRETITGDVQKPLILLQAATLGILLIVCANLANLLLGAGTGRINELEIRAALGATRVRIIRQLLTESLLLAIAGGALGTLIAWGGTAWLSNAASRTLLARQAIAIDPMVLAFAAALSIGAGVVFGLTPALLIARTAHDSTARSSRRSTEGPGGVRLRSLLIVGEVAISVAVLVGALLLLRSFQQLTAVNPGFHPEQIVSFQLAIQLDKHPEGTEAAFYENLYGRLRTLPGVQSVGGINILPLSGSYSCDGLQIVGRPVAEGQGPCAEARSVSADYFTTMGIPLIKGRGFALADDERAARTIVINDALARKFFPGEEPLGQRILYSSRGQNDAREIVGVVGDVHHFALDRQPVPEFYVPQPQPPSYHAMTIVMRVDGDAAALLPAVRAEVRAAEPDAPVYNVRTMSGLVADSIADARFRTRLLSLFAALALVLAIVGTYGVISIAVARRMREMGVRVALGATASDVTRLVVSQGIRPVLAGTLLGLAIGLVAARAFVTLLFNVRPADPLTFAAVAVTILTAGLVASWLPARRAGRVDPAIALRAE